MLLEISRFVIIFETLKLMSRPPETDSDKIKKYIKLYRKEFYKTMAGLLWCRCCDVSVNFSRKCYVTQHRKTDGHVRMKDAIVNTQHLWTVHHKSTSSLI